MVVRPVRKQNFCIASGPEELESSSQYKYLLVFAASPPTNRLLILGTVVCLPHFHARQIFDTHGAIFRSAVPCTPHAFAEAYNLAGTCYTPSSYVQEDGVVARQGKGTLCPTGSILARVLEGTRDHRTVLGSETRLAYRCYCSNSFSW